MAVALCFAGLLGATTAAATAALPPIRHVFVIVLENESEATSFGPNSPAPYLAKTLPTLGAYAANYYGIGHSSLDNYIAMVSGQAPNPKTSGDCPTFSDFPAPTAIDASGQETGQGCVYPANVPTLMSQLQAKGLSWRGYMDGMGANPLRESATCGHPLVGSPDLTEVATPTDQYATRHDPFVYFHSVIDNSALCNANVVNLDRLPADLGSAASTPNFVFITPNLCNDGHDASCANGGPGGLPAADAFLKTWVPRVTSSAAFRQNGLLVVTFDESVGDASACCGEKPGPYDAANNIQPGGSGPGGGVVGAVMLSPFIAPKTRSAKPYNHYSLLGSIEDIFGLPRLADAAGTSSLGSDVFTVAPPRDSGLRISPQRFSPLSHRKGGATISYRDSEAAVTKLTVQRLLPGYSLAHRACRMLAAHHQRPAHSRSCTVTRNAGSFRHVDKAGLNRVSFSGHGLAKGSYSLTVVPSASGLAGRAQTTGFQIR